ncbi:MAG TPA: DUF2085 domain-containing protein [Pyrinomonadaceae bacterium]|jgi:uncharacterized membrane protein
MKSKLFRRVSASPRLRVPPFSRPVFVWAIAATIVLGFVSLVLVAPVARSHGHSLSAFFLYEMFGRVCHQIPGRAFELAGYPLAVCARCTGIYFGFAAGVLAYPLARSLNRSDTPARKWLLLAAAPTALDFALGFFGVWENTHWSRALTGALLGAVASFYVVPGLLDLGQMIRERRVTLRGVR